MHRWGTGLKLGLLFTNSDRQNLSLYRRSRNGSFIIMHHQRPPFHVVDRVLVLKFRNASSWIRITKALKPCTGSLHFYIGKWYSHFHKLFYDLYMTSLKKNSYHKMESKKWIGLVLNSCRGMDFLYLEQFNLHILQPETPLLVSD